MPVLHISDDRGVTETFHLDRGVVRAGRSSANHLVLTDAAASREHFELSRRGPTFTIRDLGSRNGTIVNGRAIDRELRLWPGDEITVGRTRLVFSEQSEPPPASKEQPSSATVMFQAEQLASSFRSEAEAEPDRPSREDVFVLNQLARELMPVTDEHELVEMLAQRLLQVFSADRCAVVFDVGDGESIEVQALACASDTHSTVVTISSTAARHVIRDKMALQISDVDADDRFMNRHSIMIEKISSILCAPLWHGSSVFGLLYLDTTGRLGEFGKPQLALLSAVANMAAIKIDNLRLFEANIAKARMERELSLAAEIQAKMLPTGPFPCPGVRCVGFNRPCYEVGGDYYDFMPLGEGAFAVTVADVSGKGASGAMLMASCKSMLTAFVETGMPLLDRVVRLNRFVRDNSTSNKFITFFQAEVEPEAGILRYCNAGHNPPLLLAPGRPPRRLAATGPVLGLLDLPYAVEEAQFEPGALLVAYSDGVTEAANEDEEEYDENRLLAVLQRNIDLTPEEIITAILEDVEQFTGGGPPQDDVTLVVVKREG